MGAVVTGAEGASVLAPSVAEGAAGPSVVETDEGPAEGSTGPAEGSTGAAEGSTGAVGAVEGSTAVVVGLVSSVVVGSWAGTSGVSMGSGALVVVGSAGVSEGVEAGSVEGSGVAEGFSEEVGAGSSGVGEGVSGVVLSPPLSPSQGAKSHETFMRPTDSSAKNVKSWMVSTGARATTHALAHVEVVLGALGAAVDNLGPALVSGLIV